jgi:hypothetical protein
MMYRYAEVNIKRKEETGADILPRPNQVRERNVNNRSTCK